MKEVPLTADKTAIGLSILCMIHCIGLPFIIVLLPSLAALNLADEAFHIWMLVAVVPISLYALQMGCRKHKRVSIFITGGIGLGFLIAAAFLGHDVLSEPGEKFFTVFGALVIAFSHYLNHQLCRQHDHECHQ